MKCLFQVKALPFFDLPSQGLVMPPELYTQHFGLGWEVGRLEASCFDVVSVLIWGGWEQDACENYENPDPPLVSPCTKGIKEGKVARVGSLEDDRCTVDER